jgi:high mobility group protein B2
MANKSRDPNAPKRNLSAYLLYQNAMRDQFKAMNPGMTFGQLAKYTSAMYSEMPPAEKEAWVARAEADKARYLHELASYVPPPGYDAKGDTIASTIPGAKGAVSRKPGGKVERDSNAPKRNVSAYLLYQNAMREQFKRENPGMTFGQLAKYTSHMYKNLTPEEKATWDARAAQDKARYSAEISQYVPPPGHDARGNMIESHRPRKRSKRSPKDPNAPKRASGAYVFFTNEMRPVVMKQFPGIKFVEMGRVLGERWRALGPAEKKRFEEMAGQDKERFQRQMQEYSMNQVNLQQQQAAAAQAAAQAAPPAQVAQHYQQQMHHAQQPQQHLHVPQQHAAPPQQQYQHYDPNAQYQQQQQQQQQQYADHNAYAHHQYN